MKSKALARYNAHMRKIPKDGRLLKLLVYYGTDKAYGPLEDASIAWPIGFNQVKDTDEDLWEMAGWNWEQDHFTEGHGEIIDWTPFLSKKERKQLNKLRKRSAKK